MNKISVLQMWSGDGRQRVPDFATLKAQGIVGIIHRATEGTQFSDPLYLDRRQAAIGAGLLWGAYHTIDAGAVDVQAARFLGATAANRADGGADELLAVEFILLEQSATAYQFYEFCGTIDRQANVSTVIRSDSYIRTVLFPPQENAPIPPSYLAGVLSFVRQHRFWSADNIFINEAPPLAPYPWEKTTTFLQRADPFPSNPIIGKMGATYSTADISQNWAR